MQQTSVSESSYRSFLKHLFAALRDHLPGKAVKGSNFSVRCREVMLYNYASEHVITLRKTTLTHYRLQAP